MQIEDDRTAEQKKTHTWFVIGTDRFMSGWGKAEGGKSYAVWACKMDDRSKVFDWVTNRSDMKKVREVYSPESSPYQPRGIGHCQMYAVTDEHPSLR